MTILELASQLETQINERLEKFAGLTSRAEEILREIDKLELAMHAIVTELKPVESMVLHFNPQYKDIFLRIDSLDPVRQSIDYVIDQPKTSSPAQAQERAEIGINTLHKALKKAGKIK